MAKKVAASAAQRVRISGQRAGRLYKLLEILSGGPTTRAQLLKRLKVGMRTFYRDVDLLRSCGVAIEIVDTGYMLRTSFDDALHAIPFPNPELTFGEVVVLMKGRSASHLKLKNRFKQLTK